MQGLCVTVAQQDFIYVGGSESGVVVGLINYPRFPRKPEELLALAEELAETLRKKMCQHSFLLESTTETKWVSYKDEANR